MDAKSTVEAITGASYVYLCIGLPYDSKIWTKNWPIIVENVINACQATNAKLIFLDNIYMYGPAPLNVPFNETHLEKPQSVKGVVRKKIADMILDAHKNNKIKAVIGRAADFYGPNAKNSSLYISVLDRILEEKNPQWIGKPGQKHTYAYNLDIGRALVLLAIDDSTYGEVWHLPVGEKITIEKIIDLVNLEVQKNYKISFMPRILLKILSLFIPILGEVKEVIYQFDSTYDMNFDKFKTKFPSFQVTSYKDGLSATIKSFSSTNPHP